MELVTIVYLHESHSYYSGDNETYETREIYYIDKNELDTKLQELVKNKIYKVSLDNVNLTLPLYGLIKKHKEILSNRTEIEKSVQILLNKIDNDLIKFQEIKNEEDKIIGTLVIEESRCDDGFTIEYVENY
jgi:hypothetical protein